MDTRNYKDDQNNEIEALDSIYCGEMDILEVEPYHKFSIPIATENFYDEGNDEEGLSCQLVFTYTAKYPDAPPIVEVEETKNFEMDQEEKLIEHVTESINEYLGMEMIFSLVSSAQEWLNLQWDEYKREKEEARVAKLKAYEEVERKKFEGTRVTVETFLTWRTAFETDMGITQKKEKASQEAKKLTGKELFLRDTTLNESDLKFLLEAGESLENVKIDESLFQNLGDLELEESDDDSDDDDYVPGQDV